MAKYPSKVSVATAVENYSKLDLSCTHDTTSNFMDFQVCKYMELVPKQKVSLSHNVFARMDPLNVPTYGDASIHMRAFFVPYRTVFPAWNDFITDAVHTYADNVSSLVTNVPLISNSTFVEALRHASLSESMAPGGDIPGDFYGFEHGLNDDNVPIAFKYKFNERGARFFKLLYSLGYRIDFNLNNTEDYYSALPLFCACRVFLDWYYPNAYVQDEFATRIYSWLKYDQGMAGNRFEDEFTYTDLLYISQLLDKVNYDSDYLVSAWDNPVSPNDGASSGITINDITLKTFDSEVSSGGDGNYGTPVLGVQDLGQSQTSAISQYALTALKSVSDYVKRHQIAGSRALDRYFAQWGIQLGVEKLGLSMYLSEFTNDQPLQFGDVTSTADTTEIGGLSVGAYAGKGISTGENRSLDFTADEFGMLIIVSTIVPRITNTQGQDRITMHKTRLDFYTPEFDGLGVQALATKEVIVPLDARQEYATSEYPLTNGDRFDYAEQVFGFVSRYAEYKRGVDQITGDYLLGTRNALLAPWNMNRNLIPMLNEFGVRGLKHSRNFVTGDDSEQYSRIFQYTQNDSNDHFFVRHTFKITSMFPGSSLFDTYEFENEDKAEKVAVDVNGVKVN